MIMTDLFEQFKREKGVAEMLHLFCVVEYKRQRTAF